MSLQEDEKKDVEIKVCGVEKEKCFQILLVWKKVVEEICVCLRRKVCKILEWFLCDGLEVVEWGFLYIVWG